MPNFIRTLACIAVTVTLLLAVFAQTATAHAVLTDTEPAASQTTNTRPESIRMSFSEPTESRFSSVSVSDENGKEFVTGVPRAVGGDRSQLQVDVKRMKRGWYLVYWRVISADGHPVRGAYTIAVGPSAGPAPVFPLAKTSETAARPLLIAFRWVLMISLLTIVGCAMHRLWIMRPLRLVERGGEHLLGEVSHALYIASFVGIVSAMLYAHAATAQFAMRSFWSVGDVFPLIWASNFGRSYEVFSAILVALVFSFGIANVLDNRRPVRSVAALCAAIGATLAAAALILIPGIAGHAMQAQWPGEMSISRTVALVADWIHLATASIWLGGLVAIAAISRKALRESIERCAEALRIVVPRYSRVALLSVSALIVTGTVSSAIHIPTWGSLLTTSYGQSLFAKVGLVVIAVCIAARNRTKYLPQIAANTATARPLVMLVMLEAIVIAGAVVGAALLTSLAPPASALGKLGKVDARVGPGTVDEKVRIGDYRVRIHVDPNRAARDNDFGIELTRKGRPVHNAKVIARFAMLDMEMGQLSYRLAESEGGVYSNTAPALVMAGRWSLRVTVDPVDGKPFATTIVDKVGG